MTMTNNFKEDFIRYLKEYTATAFDAEKKRHSILYAS